MPSAMIFTFRKLGIMPIVREYRRPEIGSRLGMTKYTMTCRPTQWIVSITSTCKSIRYLCCEAVRKHLDYNGKIRFLLSNGYRRRFEVHGKDGPDPKYFGLEPDIHFDMYILFVSSSNNYKDNMIRLFCRIFE